MQAVANTMSHPQPFAARWVVFSLALLALLLATGARAADEPRTDAIATQETRPILVGPDGKAQEEQFRFWQPVRVRNPRYPRLALDYNPSGCVLVGYRIESDGRPAEAFVVGEWPARGWFTRAALGAIRQFRFAATSENPDKTPEWNTYIFTFDGGTADVDDIAGMCTPVTYQDRLGIAAEFIQQDAPTGVAEKGFATKQWVARRKVAPHYPRKARSKGLQGCALVRFTVNAAGKPTDIEVIWEDPPGHRFGVEAARAAEQWEYVPSKLNPQRVPDQDEQYFRFSIAGMDSASLCDRE